VSDERPASFGDESSISEFELAVLRAIMLDAARSKAGPGELRISVPFGYSCDQKTRRDFFAAIRLAAAVSFRSIEDTS
jgi:hypothetical protein